MTPRPYRYLITDAGGARVAIVHAPGGEQCALLREHGEGASIEETADGWSVRVGDVQTTYRAYSGEAGHEAVDLLSKTGHPVEVRLDYFMELAGQLLAQRAGSDGASVPGKTPPTAL